MRSPTITVTNRYDMTTFYCTLRVITCYIIALLKYVTIMFKVEVKYERINCLTGFDSREGIFISIFWAKSQPDIEFWRKWLP